MGVSKFKYCYVDSIIHINKPMKNDGECLALNVGSSYPNLPLIHNIGSSMHACAISQENLAMITIIAPAVIRVAALIVNPYKPMVQTFEAKIKTCLKKETHNSCGNK
jgi:hypothetical protein